ncbi:MAG: hypothetical protein U0V54_15470 [Saprospiraceae bacterium]
MGNNKRALKLAFKLLKGSILPAYFDRYKDMTWHTDFFKLFRRYHGCWKRNL